MLQKKMQIATNVLIEADVPDRIPWSCYTDPLRLRHSTRSDVSKSRLQESSKDLVILGVLRGYSALAGRYT